MKINNLININKENKKNIDIINKPKTQNKTIENFIKKEIKYETEWLEINPSQEWVLNITNCPYKYIPYISYQVRLKTPNPDILPTLSSNAINSFIFLTDYDETKELDNQIVGFNLKVTITLSTPLVQTFGKIIFLFINPKEFL